MKKFVVSEVAALMFSGAGLPGCKIMVKYEEEK